CGGAGGVDDKSGKCTEARNEVGIEHSAGGKRVGRSEEKVREAAGGSSRECDGEEGRLKAELVHGAHVFASEVNAVAGTDGGGLVTTDIVGKTDAGSQAGRVIVFVGGVAAGRIETGDS